MVDLKSIIGSVHELPPLSDINHLIHRLYSHGAENVDILELVKVIESDAILTANILRMINAPYYGFSKKISSVSQAVTLFGTELIYSFVLQFSITTTVRANMGPYGVSNKQFNDIAHMQSALMSQWYSKIDLHHALLLTSLALIMESGKLVVAREVVKNGHMQEFLEGLKKVDDVSLYEYNIFGSSSYFISGLLFEHWNLDPLYVDILKSLDFEHKSTPQIDAYVASLDVVRTAVNVKNIFTKESLAEATAMVEDMGFMADDFLKVAKRIKEKYEKLNR
jgi:HD-like signal output (HDOD) protein